MISDDRLVIAADGSCLVNPDGPGGWAWAVSPEHWRAGGHPSTTNNKMELRAVFEALCATPVDRPLLIETDSLYVIKALTVWLDKWQRNGWQNSKREPVKNRAAIVAIDQLLLGRDVTWRHVKGHAGHVLNEVCDLRAGLAAAATRGGTPVEIGPGLPS
ncbi:MAG: ribonuclease [Pseudonocardiales bacterium]|nr:ribonuclease [Jatrophihabitans sp.]MDT4930478.1 ribonuclease [Pseudonocardiales bacterium]